MLFLVRASALRGLKMLVGAREARERALGMGMDALLQNLGSCEGSDNNDSAFEHNVKVKREQVINAVGSGGISWAICKRTW